MNYYNPYYMPYMNIPTSAVNTAAKTGLFSRLLGGSLNFSSILNGTQRVLSITNQVIPLVKQAGPIVKNAKTMFKVMSEFNKPEKSIQNINEVMESSKESNNITKNDVISTNNINLERKNITTSNLTFFQ